MTVTRTYNKNVLMEEETHKQLITPNHKMLGKECCLQKCPSRRPEHRISKLAKQTARVDYAHSIECRPSFVSRHSVHPMEFSPTECSVFPFSVHLPSKTFLFQKSFPDILL